MRLALIEPQGQNFNLLTYRCIPCVSEESFLQAIIDRRSLWAAGPLGRACRAHRSKRQRAAGGWRMAANGSKSAPALQNILPSEPIMRISENTPSHLKLRDRTLWISAVCFAAAAILLVRFAFDRDQSEQLIPAGLSLMFGLAFLHATDVTFDKSARICFVPPV